MDADKQERVSTEIEKIVGGPNPLGAEKFAPGGDDGLFQLGGRCFDHRIASSSDARRGQRRPIDLSIRVSGSEFTGTNSAGIMCCGSFSARNFRSSVAVIVGSEET